MYSRGPHPMRIVSHLSVSSMPTTAAWIGLRHTLARGSSRAAPVITLVGVAGLALAAAVLVTVMAVMAGFEHELRTRVLALLPHVTLTASPLVEPTAELDARIRAVPGVVAAAPFVRGPALVAATRGEGLRGVVLQGIEPQAQASLSILAQFVTAPEGLGVLTEGRFDVLLGARLARELGVEVGDDVQGRATPLGWFASQRRFSVVGTFDTGTESDDRLVLTHIDAASRLFRTGGRVHGYEVRGTDLFASRELLGALQRAVSGYGLIGYDWSRSHGPLYRAISVQKRILFVLLSMLVAVAAVNVVSALVMTVADRQPQIAILQSMGAGRPLIAIAFAVQGLLMGAVGIGGGVLLGVLAADALPGAISAWQTLTGSHVLGEYFIHYLPTQLVAADIAAVAAIGLAITLLAVVYPAWRASRVPAAEILRHE